MPIINRKKILIFVAAPTILSAVYAVLYSTIFYIVYSYLLMDAIENQSVVKYLAPIFCILINIAIIITADYLFIKNKFRIDESFKDNFLAVIVYLWIFLIVTGTSSRFLLLIINNNIELFAAHEVRFVEFYISMLSGLVYFVPIIFPKMIVWSYRDNT